MTDPNASSQHVILKDGTVAQPGPVGTLVHHLQQYNAGQRGQVEEQIRYLIPTLFKLGLFDVFSPDEWMQGENAGRRFVGEEAVRYRVQLHAAALSDSEPQG